MSTPTWIEIVNKLVTPTIAAASVFYAYLQYRRTQRWKAADLAISMIRELEEDPRLALACQSLDWGVGPLLIPEQYRPFFSKDQHGEYPDKMDHEPTVMTISLRPQLDPQTLQDPRGLVYRHCFNRLFEHFDYIYLLLCNGQLLRQDLRALKYWLRAIHYYEYAPTKISPTDVFQPALQAWGFLKVNALARILGALDDIERKQ